MFFAAARRSLTTRRQILGSAALVALPRSRKPGRSVPPDLAEACRAYGKAVDRANTLDTDSTVNAAAVAEEAMIDAMRRHGIGAAVVAGRLYVDSWAGGPSVPNVGCEAGGCLVELADVRGL